MSGRLLSIWLSGSIAFALVQAKAEAAVAAPTPELEARGARRLVAVVKAPDADGTCQEIVTRIIAELMADGVPVVALTCAGSDPACVAFSGAAVSAIVLVRRRDNIRAVEVRAGDAIGSRGAGPAVVAAHLGGVQRVANLESAGAPAALAVRTVELLRAMLIDVADLSDVGGVTAPTPEVAVEQKADSEIASDVVEVADSADTSQLRSSTVLPIGPHNVTMNIGASVIGGLARLETAYGPSLTVGRRTSDHVLLALMLAGPAFGRDQTNAAGTISIRHEMAVLEADLLGLFWKRLVLRAGLGAGVYHIHVDGQVNPTSTLPSGRFGNVFPGSASGPFPTGRSAGGFSALLSWSAGLVANFTSDIGLFVDGRIFVLTPTPVVLLNGLEVGRAGNPGIVVTTGVEFRL
jgi:hypothetical protein